MRSKCPNCGRRFNCDGGEDCWCLKVDHDFDYGEMILRTGATGCACPVCLTGRTDLAEVGVGPAEGTARRPSPVRQGRRRRKNREE